MKAAVLEQINEPLAIAEVGLGTVSRGQVLVKMKVSGICGAQLQEIAGFKGNAKFVPHLLGHEGCGTVEEVGPDVSEVKKGDKVILHWKKGEGIESDFPSYTFNGKEIRSGKVTTFSEYTIVSENRVTSVPHDIPDDVCALLGCGLSTALGAVFTEAQVREGERVLVVGFGGLGAAVVKAARIAKAGAVIVTDIHDSKRGAAEALGADLFINILKEDIGECLEKRYGAKDAHVIIETSGSARAVEGSLPYLAGGGRYIMIGQPSPGESIVIQNAKHLFDGEGKSIRATQGGGFAPTRDIPRYLALYRDGTLDINHLITHRTTLDNLNNAIQLMRDGKANRIMIDL